MRHKTSGLQTKKLAKMADFCHIQRMGEKAGIGLANRWFQPLTHVSKRGFPRDAAIYCQRDMREKRGEQRFAVAQSAAHSVRAVFRLSASCVEGRK